MVHRDTPSPAPTDPTPGPHRDPDREPGRGPAAWWHTTVEPGRHTAELREPMAVFLIGMRVNRPWNPRRWWWVTKAMPAMLAALADVPELGLRHVEQFTRGRTSLSLQYWESPQALMAFAADRDNPHLEAWRRFNRELADRDDVGIWHETYVVEPGDYEGIYVNMPLFGMAAAAGRVPVGTRSGRARQRLSA
ncbi:DUF4188 domain-containing protein [Salsipaludibacter albus]|uniref:DUF4188 domain-containing protein n=1 Tax=Salsipaludibacter albus TaxID=2849650 RepID=UPI001EE3EDB3|nr:DUF4188 domain-containing protein [Salsipaludibacter albus]MBY5162005.1 DUF4188 domain-containing protein [Salsipaludibacter albus]